MTIQAWWLLGRLKYVQRYKDAWFAFEDESNTIKTMYVPEKYVRRINLIGYRNSLESTLNHLADRKYIELVDGGGRVLHAGWHWGQIVMGKIASFLFRSIAVPVVVAFLTAVITMWLSGPLQLP